MAYDMRMRYVSAYTEKLEEKTETPSVTMIENDNEAKIIGYCESVFNQFNGKIQNNGFEYIG
jgi:hypothetical protein